MLLAVYSTIDNLSLLKHTFAKLPDALSEKAYRKVNWVKLLIALRLELAPTGKTFLLPSPHDMQRALRAQHLSNWCNGASSYSRCHLSSAITLINSASASNGNVPVVAVAIGMAGLDVGWALGHSGMVELFPTFVNENCKRK